MMYRVLYSNDTVITLKSFDSHTETFKFVQNIEVSEDLDRFIIMVFRGDILMGKGIEYGRE